MKLLASYTRVRIAADAFLNHKDLQQKLNEVMWPVFERTGMTGYGKEAHNVVITDKPEGGLEIELSVAEGSNPGSPEQVEQVMQALNFFLGEFGVEHGEFHTTRWPRIFSADLQGFPGYESEDWSHLENKWMAQALESGKAVNIRDIAYEMEPGVFRLNRFIDNVDYVDPEGESFIQGMFKELGTDIVYATLDMRYLNDPSYELIWAR